MKKLISVLCLLSSISIADSLDMSTLQCKGKQLNSATTLADVQKNCTLKKQETKKGLFQVEFINDATGKSVKCDFTTNQPTALLNGCK